MLAEHDAEQTFPRKQFDPARPWTTGDEAKLRSMADLGAEAIADLLDRSVFSIRNRAHKLGVSLRQPGQNRGRLLGLPNGTAGLMQSAARVQRMRDLRERVLAGETDPAVLLARAKWLAAGMPLCPKCSTRPAEVETTGFCRECHLRLYLEVDEATEIRAAQRDNDRGRQRKHRAKEEA